MSGEVQSSLHWPISYSVRCSRHEQSSSSPESTGKLKGSRDM